MSADEIQRARDVLAKWRKEAREGRWHFAYLIPASKNLGTIDGDMEREDFYVASDVTSEDARLIIGLAGNPDLLDAIDSLLATAQREDLRALGLGPLLYDAERTAETIIAADDRMRA
jgi:hypothetical protein